MFRLLPHFRFILALAAFAGGAAAAREPLPPMLSRSWLVDDGLPNNTVRRAVQDSRGFTWLATASGLARFDGREFVDYPLPMAARDAKFDVRDLTVGQGDTLLLLPESGGVAQLRGSVFSIHPASVACGDKILVDIFAEPDGTLWLGTTGDEVIRWHEGKATAFGADVGLSRRNNRFTFVRDNRGRTWVAGGEFLGYFEAGRLVRYPQPLGAGVFISPSASGGLWISTTEHLARLEVDVLTMVLAGPPWQSVEHGGVQALREDNHGVLWIGTRRLGLYRLAGADVQAVATPHAPVNGIMVGEENNIWLATNGAGLVRLRPRIFSLIDSSLGLVDDVSTGVCVDAAGAIWCANRAGGFVRVHDGTVDRFPRANGTFPYAITITVDAANTVWGAASDGLYRLAAGGRSFELVTRELKDAHVLYLARNRTLWVGYGANGFGYFRDGQFTALTAHDGYPRRRIKAVVEDPEGALWVATDDRRVFQWVHDRLEPRLDTEHMPGGLIYDLYWTGRNELWIATSRGLVLKRGERVDLLTAAQGLPDDQLSLVAADDRDRLWLGSRRGLYCVQRAELLDAADGRLRSVTATAFGREDGLNGASALNGMQPLVWKSSDHRLWFGTHAGIVGVDPATAAPERNPPRVYLDHVSVDRVPVAAGGRLQLLNGVREIDFKFTAPSFAAPEKLRLWHRLDGYDFDWVETQADWRATYLRLPPGSYELRAAAGYAGAVRPADALLLTVIVVPQWWQTVTFRLLAAAAGIAVMVAMVRFWSHRRLRRRLELLEREHALEKERARIARDLHDDLGGSLTQIGMLADRIKREAAQPELKEELGKLASNTRRLAGELESIVWTVSSKNNTWDRLAAFLEQSSRAFCREFGLECTVEGSTAVPDAPVEPEVQSHILAVAKEALNNVLKHAHATRVTIVFALRFGRFELRLADDGRGFDVKAPELNERNGLNNMRARIAEVGGQLSIRSAPQRGTEIVLEVPLAAIARRPPSNDPAS